MKRKGLTLVEVMVALGIFLMVFTSVLTILMGSKKTVLKQEEYFYFETVCKDIDKYSDRYKKNWAMEYFGHENPNVYYDSNYQIVPALKDATYVLSYRYQVNVEDSLPHLIIDIKNVLKDYKVIDNLDYGGARYA